MNYNEIYSALSDLYDEKMYALEAANSNGMDYTATVLYPKRAKGPLLVVNKKSRDNASFEGSIKGQFSIGILVFDSATASDIGYDTNAKVADFDISGPLVTDYKVPGVKKLITKADGSLYSYNELKHVQQIVIVLCPKGAQVVRISRGLNVSTSGKKCTVHGKYVTADNKLVFKRLL